MNYVTVPAELTSPAVMVPVSDALDFGRDLVAGFDNLLLELADNLDSGLPDSLPESQR